MKSDDTRTCLVCGTQFPRSKEFCPICILREAMDEQIKPAKKFLKGVLPNRSRRPLSHRFEHYELITDQDGKPVELGRGAMGVTYKGFDVDLQCPVTLKVISEQFLGDESARLRFLREARAAASVRHANVASVLHLGRTGNRYFYAMEFVEGETLERFSRRSEGVEVKLALEILAQVAAGLAAIHEQNLVHRDIKPSNIMVCLKGDGTLKAKIIDLGLAKSLNEPGEQTAISTPGAFAGTPEFASPEQFAGVQVDIRSDLYSLGVVLWEMLTGQTPFRGTPGEVMYQHQRAPLPLELLKAVPQPAVVLIEVLLEKDPTLRFQNPAELLNALPTIVDVIAAGRRITRRQLQQIAPSTPRAGTRRPSATRLAPKKISLARLPVTGSDVFGREEDIAFLDDAWANQHVNVVTIVAWAGVGKSTLVNCWLRRMAAERYRAAQLVFGWSFYRQGSSGGTSSADEFLDAALTWFGDPDPGLGTAWEKGERLAKLVSRRRTLLLLDGLEPLQNPPGPQEGCLRDPSLQALLRELAVFNNGLCVITTRLSVADIAEHVHSSVLRRDLEQLSNDAGAKLLLALRVKGDEKKLRAASDEFDGHCLALTLLGSFLTDAYGGDIRCSKQVSHHLVHDVRQGAHARRVMASYQSWWGEGPELATLRLLGFFDRPADEKALEALLKPPAIPGLTESLADLSSAEWRALLARLRRARLLAGEDPHQPGQIDAHPLIREYFGEQLRDRRTEAWQEGNRRLYHHYGMLVPELPETLREMEPLFLAAICACNAGLFRECLHEIYVARIQRGSACFAARVLGAREALLSVLVHFFENDRWGSPMKEGVGPQRLTAEDQLFIVTETALYLTATRGHASSEAYSCYERLELLCSPANRPVALYMALIGQWRCSLFIGNLSTTMRIAKRVYSLAQEQNDAELIMGAHNVLTCTHLYLGDFESARQHATCNVRIWRSGSVQSDAGELESHVVNCLCLTALSEWHFGDITSCKASMAEVASLTRDLNDSNTQAMALYIAALVGNLERDPVEVERVASDLVELSTIQSFAHWLALGTVLHGWAYCALGHITEGIAQTEDGIEEYRRTGSTIDLPHLLSLKAEALHLADRSVEALETIREAERLAERSEARWWCAELHRLRGVFLAALGAQESEIEASFCAAIKTAKEQKSVSLAKRAEATYAEYRRQKASAAGGRGFRLPL